MKILDRISLLLVVIGAIDWGTIGLFQYDIIGAMFGSQASSVSRIIFTLVGLAGLWCISLFFRERNAVHD